MVVSPILFNWKLRVITLRFVSFSKLAVTLNMKLRNNEIHNASITRNLLITQFRWKPYTSILSPWWCWSPPLALAVSPWPCLLATLGPSSSVLPLASGEGSGQPCGATALLFFSESCMSLWFHCAPPPPCFFVRDISFQYNGPRAWIHLPSRTGSYAPP